MKDRKICVGIDSVAKTMLISLDESFFRYFVFASHVLGPIGGNSFVGEVHPRRRIRSQNLSDRERMGKEASRAFDFTWRPLALERTHSSSSARRRCSGASGGSRTANVQRRKVWTTAMKTPGTQSSPPPRPPAPLPSVTSMARTQPFEELRRRCPMTSSAQTHRRASRALAPGSWRAQASITSTNIGPSSKNG